MSSVLTLLRVHRFPNGVVHELRSQIDNRYVR